MSLMLRSSFIGLLVWVSAAVAFANTNGQVLPPPDCMKGSQRLNVNNEQMLQVKLTQKNQYTDRGNLSGTVTRVFDDRNSHDHFEINIGSRAQDVVEIIYNKEFGPITVNIQPGMRVQACGDFINSFAPAGRYPASPSGAIIHWLHLNPRNQGKEHGYLSIDGRLYGYDWDFARQADENRRRQHGRRLNVMPIAFAY